MAEVPTSFSELLSGYGTTDIGDGMKVESVFALLKVRAEDGSAAWSVRSGGVQLPPEELLGVLEALTTSMRQRLTMAWRHETPPTVAGIQLGPIKFSELLAGLDTTGVGDQYVIESVFAVIKARQDGGGPVWFARSSEMKLSPEERLGALEGYSSTVRQNLADKWQW